MNRNRDLDILKGIAIIAVVLYHLELLPLGYLGVDIFLIINGYLITKGLEKDSCKGSLNYIDFLAKRIVRLLPLVVLASAVSLCLGYFTMLPDDLENLGQSIVASSFFANNILSCITTGNYWDLINTYKPLMHMWYLGVVFQFYLIFPLFFLLCHKTRLGKLINIRALIGVLTFLSFILHLSPLFTTAQKFYYLPFRFFELGFGGLIALYSDKIIENSALIAKYGIVIVILTLLLGGETSYLLLTNILTGCVIVFSLLPISNEKNTIKFLHKFALAGKASFSIFIWHQVIFAFYKYAIESEISLKDYIVIFLFIIFVSWASYYLIEKTIGKFSKEKYIAISLISVFFAVLMSCCGGYLYYVSGVVRDVPELNIVRTSVHKGMLSEYTDRIYKMQVPFEENDKPNILVVGDSYARDMMNVILESSYKDSVNLSYAFPHDTLTEDEQKRIQKANVILLRAEWMINDHKSLAEEVINRARTNLIYGIGTKEYGGTNGNEYQKRNKNGYYSQVAKIENKYIDTYNFEKLIWRDNYIDFIKPVSDDKYYVKVFTPNKKFISQDCRHLTQDGAKYYSQLFDLSFLMNYNKK